MIGNFLAKHTDKTSDNDYAFLQDNISQETTLDSFIRHWAKETPNAFAFTDAPNKKLYGLGEPLQLTYLDAHDIIADISEQFRQHGLNPGDVLAIQLPNTAELPIIIIAAIRAGLIPCLFPISWRKSELDKAFQMIPARALVTVGEFSEYHFSQMMCELAFDHIHIRFVYGIGPNQTEGVTSLNNHFGPPSLVLNDSDTQSTNFTPHIHQPAIITWSARPGIGFRPIYRTHAELIAAGIMTVYEVGLSSNDRMLNTYPLTGLIGLSTMLMPSLLVGSFIIQHHPFDYKEYLSQIRTELATYAIAPVSVLKSFVEGDVFSKKGKTLNNFGCVWQTPYEYQYQNIDHVPDIPIYDIHNLNETVTYISKRIGLKDQGCIKLGEVQPDNFQLDNTKLLETRFRGRMNSMKESDQKYHGTLYVRGASVPKGSGLPTNSKSKQNKDDEWINTGLDCSIPKATDKMDRVKLEIDQEIIYHGGVIMFAEEMDLLYSGYASFEDAIVIKKADPIMGDSMVVVAVPKQDAQPTLDDFLGYLENEAVATYKIPKNLILVDMIPRNEVGTPLRSEVAI